MALVNGPLFSLGASGKLANSLVYSKWKGRDYVREFVIPANPRSLGQLGQRGTLAALVGWWASIAPTDKASWAAAAAAANVSPFNAYMSQNLIWLRDLVDFKQNGLGGGTPSDANADNIACSVEGNKVSGAISWDTGPAAGELIVFCLTTASPPGGARSLPVMGFAIAAGVDGVIIEARNVPPGTYYASAGAYGSGGNPVGLYTDETTVTVT